MGSKSIYTFYIVPNVILWNKGKYFVPKKIRSAV